ncbi:Ncapd2, partial [Symbiodinium microadriaticum]
MGIVHENFLRLAWTYALELLERKADGLSGTGKVETNSRKICVNILTLSMRQLEHGSSSHGSGVSSFVTALVECVSRHEHMGPVVAELCCAARVGSAVCAELMNEVGGMNITELSKSGGAAVKNVGIFLTSVAEMGPEVITLYLPLIMNHLDSDVYQIRSAIVTVMGFTIAFIYRQVKNSLTEEGADDFGANEDQEGRSVNIRSLVRIREDMLDILVERARDTSSYTRAAVLRTWTFLVEAEALPITRIGSIAEVALDRLNDKTAAVRKGALVLMTALLEFNPFSGNLSVGHYTQLRDEIDKRLTARMSAMSAEKAAAAMESLEEEESGAPEGDADTAEDQMDMVEIQEDPEVVALSAELGKCLSCLELLQSIDAAVPIIEKMLSSRTSSDVVEALRFSARA